MGGSALWRLIVTSLVACALKNSHRLNDDTIYIYISQHPTATHNLYDFSLDCPVAHTADQHFFSAHLSFEASALSNRDHCTAYNFSLYLSIDMEIGCKLKLSYYFCIFCDEGSFVCMLFIALSKDSHGICLSFLKIV